MLYVVVWCIYVVYQPEGSAPISSTNKALSDRWRISMPDGSQEKCTPPQALTAPQILEVVQHYRQAALNAIRAGIVFISITLDTTIIYFNNQI